MMPKLMLTLAVVTAVTITLIGDGPATAHAEMATDDGGGMGWCSSYLSEAGGSRHDFYSAHNLECTTGKHAMVIPGFCNGGGATHIPVDPVMCP
jgi:hypothetical protein